MAKKVEDEGKYVSQDRNELIPTACDAAHEGEEQCYVLRNLKENKFAVFEQVKNLFGLGTDDINQATKFIFQAI